MQFNDLYCLARPEVHTISCGVAKPSDFDEHIAALAYRDSIAPIEARLRAEMERILGANWCAHWSDSLAEFHEMPDQVNVVEILRLWTFAKPLGLDEWAKMRYNLLSGGASHWFPGEKADRMKDERKMRAACAKNPFADRIPAILREAHALYDAAPLKRLSQTD
jgi:predicted aldo/keto reductase-like oxidoreductase